MSQLQPQNETTEKKDSPWSFVGYALVSGALSVGLYFYISQMENEGGEQRIHWIVALLYNIGGKNLTVGIFAVLAVIFLLVAIRVFITRGRE